MHLAIAPAHRPDLSALSTLLRDSKLPVEGIEAHLETTLVARRDGEIVGSAALELYDAAALLRSVAVRDTLRGQGLGQRLTQAALDLARARGVRTVYLLTTTAGAFFPRFGFHLITRAEVDPVVKESVEFKSACPASATVMKLELRAKHVRGS